MAKAKVLHREYSGMRVIEATFDLLVKPTAQDLKKAVKKDPLNCALSKCCRRLYGTDKVVFYKTVAYVELPDENGIHQIYRFTLSVGTVKIVSHFDKTGEFPLGATLVLKAPRRTSRLSYAKEMNKRLKEQKIQGLSYGREPGRKVMKPYVFDASVRNGTGMVHFARYRERVITLP
jgi:hypothetical protein